MTFNPAAYPIVAFQGSLGAFADTVCRQLFPQQQTLPCGSFEDALKAVENNQAQAAVIPLENATAGRVADVHLLLRESPLTIIAEHFAPIRHNLVAVAGASRTSIKTVYSHPQALAQCRQFIRQHGWRVEPWVDTAGAAKMVAAKGDTSLAALASDLAAQLYDLTIVQAGVEDRADNTTRFLVMAQNALPCPVTSPAVTSFIFRVRSVPAALYKALGGFATNRINLTRLESYLVDGQFTAAEFYADAEAHPDHPAMRLALEELRFFCEHVRILGVYQAASFRQRG